MSADELIGKFIRTHCNGAGEDYRRVVRADLYAIANAAADEATALRDAIAPVAETPAEGGAP